MIVGVISSLNSLKYCCLILTKNEENTISPLLSEVKQRFRSLGLGEPDFVVSDDSTDRTSELAAAEGAYVVSGGNQGLGRAYVCGLKKCCELGPDRILVLDGDGQADLNDLTSFIHAMDFENVDLVTGSRFFDTDSVSYDYPYVNRMGTRILSTYLSWMTGQRFTDSHGGLRLMTGALAKQQKIYGRHTYVQESIVDAFQKGFKIVEIPSLWRKRAHGESRVVSSVFRYARRTLPYLIFRMAEGVFKTK